MDEPSYTLTELNCADCRPNNNNNIRNFNTQQHLSGTVTMVHVAINKSINSKQNSLEQLTE